MMRLPYMSRFKRTCSLSTSKREPDLARLENKFLTKRNFGDRREKGSKLSLSLVLATNLSSASNFQLHSIRGHCSRLKTSLLHCFHVLLHHENNLLIIKYKSPWVG